MSRLVAGRRAWAALGALLIVALLGACGGQAPTATPYPSPSATVAASPTRGTPVTVTAARVATTARPTQPAAPGTPRATVAPAPATPTATPAAPTATPLVIPPAAAPAGWPVYTGQALPFTMAYPPGWLADETQLSNGLVYFYAPGADRTTFVVVASTRRPEATTSLDVLRDQWFQARTQVCLATGIVETRREVFADTTFATVGATCDRPTLLAYIVAAVGVHDGVPWVVELNAPYDDYPDDLARYFTPMLATLRVGQSGSRAVGQ
ncbi:MAG TPA: hypothetical protein VFU78_09230 [Thermomicrobiales bacterium]|jgi:hypothetical protein|nr:hypothetical protein [Thermomicrobiales bacterium]